MLSMCMVSQCSIIYAAEKSISEEKECIVLEECLVFTEPANIQQAIIGI